MDRRASNESAVTRGQWLRDRERSEEAAAIHASISAAMPEGEMDEQERSTVSSAPPSRIELKQRDCVKCYWCPAVAPPPFFIAAPLPVRYFGGGELA